MAEHIYPVASAMVISSDPWPGEILVLHVIRSVLHNIQSTKNVIKCECHHRADMLCLVCLPTCGSQPPCWTLLKEGSLRELHSSVPRLDGLAILTVKRLVSSGRWAPRAGDLGPAWHVISMFFCGAQETESSCFVMSVGSSGSRLLASDATDNLNRQSYDLRPHTHCNKTAWQLGQLHEFYVPAAVVIEDLLCSDATDKGF